MGYRGAGIGMGSVTPSLHTISGGYRWRGIKDWTPGDPRYREHEARRPRSGGDPRNDPADRAKRMAEFAKLRDGKVDVAEAGRRVGIKPRTARDYERARMDARKGAREAAGA